MKNEIYEIEKILDVYSGWLTDQLNRSCQTAIHYDVIKDKTKPNPMDTTIKELQRTQRFLIKLRKKLEENRIWMVKK